jgi:hypothetical protein
MLSEFLLSFSIIFGVTLGEIGRCQQNRFHIDL